MQRCQLFCHNQGIYLNEYMQEAMHYLFHDGGSCRIETSPLICSANQWTVFCIVGTYIMKDSRPLSSTYTESLFLHVVKHSLLFCFIFFLFAYLFIYWSGFFFTNIHEYPGQQVKGETISLYHFYHFHPLQRHLDISWIIVAESWPLRIGGSRNRTWNLRYTLFRTHSFYTCTGDCFC